MNRKSQNAAFSLVELLVAIGIIAILVTVGVVAGGKAYAYINEKKTNSYMEIIMNAVLAFQEDTGDYPDITAGDKTYFEVCGNTSNASDTLAFYLVGNEFAQERLKDLPEDAFTDTFNTTKDTNGDVTDVAGGFVDAWGNMFLYSPDGGFGGSPVIISAGPDGKIAGQNVSSITSPISFSAATSTTDSTNDDNLSSEKN